MKKTIAFLCACLMALSAMAVPAKPGVRTYRQPDGTTVQYIVHGDEYYHFVTDLNGNLMVKNAAGYYVRTGEKPDNAKIKARRAQGRMQPRRRMPNTGNVNLAPRGLFILVNFADEDAKFKSSNSLEEMRKMLNEEGYNYDGAPGSVKDYFKAQSGGKYNPQFDVYGPVELPKSYVHYGENDYNGDDMYPDSMVIEACQALEDKIDFTLYDGDNDGEIDFVYIIYAGKGEADTEVEDYIWPHQWSIGDADNGGAGHTVYLDGKLLNTYACGPELNGTSGNRNGIGTLCHEFSHVLGLPDYYDTEYGDNDEEGRTPYSWSPMDAGSYNNDGITPPNWSAYDKYYVGWFTPAILNSEKTVELPADGKTSYCVKLDGIQPEATSTDTVYYLENRQRSGWDEYLPGHGMLIWQVVYDEDAWKENVPNNTAGEPRCTVVSASGKKKNIGTGADPFPGDNQKTQWTKYGKKYPVTDIQETLPATGDSLITFKFMDPEAEIIEGTGSYFEKVTSAPTDWSGTYLIVYEDESVAFDGSLAKLDAVGNYVNVSIEDDRIEADEDALAAAFTIASMSGGYSLKSASGSYMGQATDANGLTSSSTAIVNTITLGSDGALIAGSAGATLRFNSASNQLRFRYYKKATYANQQPIELYRLAGEGTQPGGDTPGGDTPVQPSGDEISVADALGIIADLEEGGMTADNYSIVGYVTSIPTAYSSQYNNITLTIADSKEAGAATLTLFRVEPYNDTDIQVAIGDKVLVAGQLQRYVKNGTETPEVAQGGIYSVIEKGEGGGTVTPIEPEGEEVTVAQALEVISGLESGATTDGTYTVTAYVTKIKTAYSSQYNNITLEVADTKDGTQILTLFRVVPNADSDKQVAVGDKVQAVGKLQRYAANGNETPEMAQGGVYSVIEKGEGGGTVTPIEPEGEEVTVAQALEVISGLESGATTDGTYTVTAYVTKIKTAYSSQYNNITLEVADTKDGTQILTLFRVVPNADSDKQVAVGDKVQAVGKLQRYAANGNETPEMAQGGVYSVIEKAEGGSGTVTPVEPEGEEVTVAQALEVISGLESGATTDGTYTVTAYVTKIKTAYSSQYNNITLEVADTKDGTQILTLFRVVPNADSDKQVAVGDKVQAVGKLQRYAANGNETPEMAQGGVYSVIEKGEGGGTVTPIEPEGEEVTVAQALEVISGLESGATTDGTYTVTAYVTKIKTAYSSQYNNITLEVADTKDGTQILTLFRVVPNADSDKQVAVGDKVQAVGKLQRYAANGNETPEMAQGGVYSVIEKGEGGGTVTPIEPEGEEVTVAQALEVISGLESGATTEATYTVTAYVTKIKTAYSSQYNNITLEVADTKDGTQILTLFRVVPNADSDKQVAVGDKVQAVGKLQRYAANGNETPEMAQGGVYSVIEKGEGGGTVTPIEPEGEEVTVAQALEVISGLESGATTDGTYTVTAYVTKIKTAYSSQYNNITLEIADTKGGTPILTLFRVKPNADTDQQVAVGDKVQAVGQLQRYVANSAETPEMVAGGTFSILEKGEGGGTTPVQPTGDEISVADAISVINDLAENGKTDATYTIMGYVVAITTEYSAQYNNITLTIADTKGGTVTITVFRVKPTSDSDKSVAVGDKIVVTGQLQRYVANGKETPETVAGATFSILEKGEGGGSVTPANPDYYQKVTTPITNWAGRYLIVYEPKNLAFNGGLDELDVAGNSIEVEIENDRIAVTDETKAAEFTIAAYGKGYSIKSKSGRYIGQEDNKNGLKAYKSDEILNLIALDADGAVIKSAGAYLRYNAASNNRRFRYYQSSTYTRQKTIQLYRIMDGTETPVTPDQPTPTGDELTVAQALDVISGLASGATSTADYTVTGYVTNVKTVYSSQYNNITLEIADTKGGSPILTLFRVKPNADTDQTVAVGDKVKATGKLQRYAANGNETPEMAAGGTYSVIEKGGGTTPTPVNPEGEEVTVTKALEILAGMASGAKTDAKYTVTGYVTSIKDVYSDQYNNISINIADTKGGTDVLLLYRVKPNADADKEVAVGDKVTAVVQLYRYTLSSGDLMETVAGGTYSVIEKNDGTDTPDPETPDEDPTANAVRVRAALDAIAALAEGGTTDQEYKVVGYVIAITDPFNTQYGNITFTIGDTRDAAEADRLTLFRVKPSTEADKEVKAGDRVVATGKLQRFVKDGKVTPEMVAGGIYAIVPETALEDVQLNSNDGKFVINGQLVIIRDGIWYNAQGVVIRR